MPKAFISYSWDNQAHKDRVLNLATRLQRDGIEITLDQWHAAPGDQLPAFMDTAIRKNDFVLIICTPGYKAKSEGGSSGVGFEGHIIQGHVFTSNNHRKFIPILSRHEWTQAAPSVLLGKYWIDLREGPNYERNYQELLLTLRGQRETAPPVGGGRRVYLEEEPSGVIVPRSGYIETLRAALVPKPGMFLLTGEPGSGKSTLALMFARDVQAEFEAVVFQRCGQRPLEMIVSELADTLQEELGNEVVKLSPKEKLKAVKKWLRLRRSLIVLDDVHLDENPSPLKLQRLQFKELVPGGKVSVLFTSRRKHLPWPNAGQVREVESFTQGETEAVFRNYLGNETFSGHRDSLMQFAARMEFLPLAVAAGAELLRNEFGPLDQVAKGLALAQLRNEIHDVPGLLQRAIESQGQEERRLLHAASVCTREGFWLPLALRIAGLDSSKGGQSRNHLVNAGLLRVVDQDRERFALHALLREQLHSDSDVDEFRRKHAESLEQIFEQWETRWKECRECLAEILTASKFLWLENRERQARLSLWGWACGHRIGELGTALQIAQENEKLWEKVPGSQGRDRLQASYGNQALILQDWGRLEEAMALVKEQEVICEELGNNDGLQRSYGNQAGVLARWGRLDKALALRKKQEAICLELGNKDDLQRSYGNQAGILIRWGRRAEALDLYKKQEAICEELDNRYGLQRSYGGQALVLEEMGEREKAMVLHKKEEAICEQLGNKDDLGRSYGNQALILKFWGRLEEALALHEKEQTIYAQLGNQDGLQVSFGNQAVILQAWRRFEEALALLKKQEVICEELGNKVGLGYCCWNWGLLARDMKDDATSRAKLEAALAIFSELRMPRERDAVQEELNKGRTDAASG